jgi:ferredoxin-type protein NapG
VSEKDDPKLFARRNFFRRGLREMLNPLADMLADKLKEIPDFSRIAASSGRQDDPAYVRPPGAQPEAQFLLACIRCGSCTTACPYGIIEILTRDEIARAGYTQPYSWRPYRETGTPRLAFAKGHCRRCADFPCAAACPAGALVRPATTSLILGCASVDHDACLRTNGKDCTLCVAACPAGKDALRIRRNGDVRVRREGCTGCGACEHACPVSPKAIRVLVT